MILIQEHLMEWLTETDFQKTSKDKLIQGTFQTEIILLKHQKYISKNSEHQDFKHFRSCLNQHMVAVTSAEIQHFFSEASQPANCLSSKIFAYFYVVIQSLLDADLVHHVVDEHNFEDRELYYRFRQDGNNGSHCIIMRFPCFHPYITIQSLLSTHLSFMPQILLICHQLVLLWLHLSRTAVLSLAQHRGRDCLSGSRCLQSSDLRMTHSMSSELIW